MNVPPTCCTKSRSSRSITSTTIITFLILLSTNLIHSTNAILPTAAIDVKINDSSSSYTLLASQGNFAPYLPMTPTDNPITRPMFPPQNDPLLCSDISSLSTTDNSNKKENTSPFVYIVPRGSCTFEHKALVAQLYGAAGIIIYGTLSSRYGYNATTHTIDYPLEYYDYDCSIQKGGGKVNIPKNKLIGFDDNDNNSNNNSNEKKPYDQGNDKLLSGTKESGNLCALYSDNNQFEQSCPSQKCLLTGNQTTTTTSTTTTTTTTTTPTMEACCAWDTHIFLYKDDSMSDPKTGQEYQPITIPSFYITMEEADQLINSMNTYNQNVSLIMYSRYYPKYNLSTVIIWAVGVFVAAIASYLSASEIRHVRKDVEKKVLTDHYDNNNSNNNNNGAGGAVSMRGYERVSNQGESGSNDSQSFRRAIAPEETLELTASHAIFFIVFSTAGLLTLFFFKIYNIVKVFYAFGCSGAIMQVIVLPIYYYMAKKMNFRDRVVFTQADIGQVTIIDAVAIVTSYGLGAVWIYIAFAYRHAETIPFFWIMQNIMGACMCIMFLQTMKLNSIKVASILLTAAFVYDIFFVFVTPYLTKGGKSIMVDVATSGGPPKADPSWCEKYPDGPECQGGGKFKFLNLYFLSLTFYLESITNLHVLAFVIV